MREKPMPTAKQLQQFEEFIRGVFSLAKKNLSSQKFYADQLTSPGNWITIGGVAYRYIGDVKDGDGKPHGKIVEDQSGNRHILDSTNTRRA
jgi:hypothetical protein